MFNPVSVGKRTRYSYAKIKEVMDMPHLLDIQRNSYDWFMKEGLQEIFHDISPIQGFTGNLVLSFEGFSLGKPKYDIDECKERDATYSAPLRVNVRLVNNDTGEVKEQEVFMGDFPLMTETGTFIINGAERVIVSQLVRSPGAYYGENIDPTGKRLYNATVIPNRGAWIEFETDLNDVISVRLDRNRKLPATVLIRALGYGTNDAIMSLFDNDERIRNTIDRDNTVTKEEALVEIYKRQRPGDPPTVDNAKQLLEQLLFDPKRYDLATVGRYKLTKKLGWKRRLLGKQLAEPLVDKETGEVLVPADVTIEASMVEDITIEQENNIFGEDEHAIVYIKDKNNNRIKMICSRTLPYNHRTITINDIIASISYLLNLMDGHGHKDDIDHLGNRRIRSVGELLQNQFRIGLSRMERVIRERMNTQDNDVITPQALVNIRPVVAAIKEFFGSSQLSQFMDQTNPLAEITHKRRLSALGPGGLSRERAGFEVRDVHYTHYGRLCPIETPEGPNIGLISSLCVYAKINDLGFISTPYRKVADGKVDFSEEGLQYYTAEEEEELTIAQGNAPLDDNGKFIRDKVKARFEADFPVVPPSEIDLMDVAPQQIASIAASLIPFLEHDDANRALMGSNMMRQAVPLLRPESPIVGTGLEERVCLDSRTQFVAEREGEVTYVDAKEIRIRYDRTDDEKFVSFAPEETVYTLPIYRRTNQSTTITLKPIVRKGDKVTGGQVLTEGYATQNGELALGRNLKVAFMPWKGYNYEDAIVLSEEMVKWDILTSVHVDEYLTEVRETKRGMEELTSDIPNVSEDATKDLDKQGIIRIGAHIEPGDIMIGKLTPKGESDPSPEEKLLKAIFGDKAGDVKDASLKANPSLSGTVIKTALYAKAAKEGNRRAAKTDQKARLDLIQEEFDKKAAKLYADFFKRLTVLTKGKKSAGVNDLYDVEIIAKGKEITVEKLKTIDFQNINSSNWTPDEESNHLIQELINNYCLTYKVAEAECKRQMDKIKVGDELPNGVMQLAKVYIAKKRKITVGDKMAGRHGNKGIVAKIVRQEDMPFLEDGTPVDIVLNPLGVPSRMNLGQIYETVLGWAGARLGLKFSTPIFDGATIEEICDYTDKAGLPRYGKTHLRDGGTGEWFDQPATVGVIYMIKLGHMVDDKMHARSIGPYSLITQQPLGGKAQFGGQRFGEMEVWALEAFGAANALQEILTVKSDDVTGRSKTYEAIVKGDPMPNPGIPESLNVLLHELRGLGLKVTLD